MSSDSEIQSLRDEIRRLRGEVEPTTTPRQPLDVLARVLPSVSWIKVVEAEPGTYLAFEGNGRIEALQAVFGPDDGIAVEVEAYRFRNPRKIVRRLTRVRRLNGLID